MFILYIWYCFIKRYNSEKIIVILLIAGDIINNYIDGSLTYSTQKIRYRPKVGGREIFGDAYNDKLWLVIRDDVRRKDNYRLVNSAYRSNRGGSPDEIARNAQIAQAQGQY